MVMGPLPFCYSRQAGGSPSRRPQAGDGFRIVCLAQSEVEEEPTRQKSRRTSRKDKDFGKGFNSKRGVWPLSPAIPEMSPVVTFGKAQIVSGPGVAWHLGRRAWLRL